MSTSVVLPALGESVTEGTVTRWLKKVGDTIQADEGLLEISTDKVDTEIPSPVSGVMRSCAGPLATTRALMRRTVASSRASGRCGRGWVRSEGVIPPL